MLDDDTSNNPITYSAPFEFKAYIGGKELTIPRTYNNFQVHKLSSLQSYSILVTPVNIDLEFNTAADYVNGKNVTFPNAVTMTSNVAYQLRVSSIYPNFSTASGHILPLDVVRVQLSGDGQITSPMALSDAMVTLLYGTATGGGSKVYDLIFSTVANDDRTLNLPTDQYSTQVLFEITPQ